MTSFPSSGRETFGRESRNDRTWCLQHRWVLLLLHANHRLVLQVNEVESDLIKNTKIHRTAVNCASGVKTQAGGLFTGALVMVCLACLMEYCAFIPKVSIEALCKPNNH